MMPKMDESASRGFSPDDGDVVLELPGQPKNGAEPTKESDLLPRKMSNGSSSSALAVDRAVLMTLGCVCVW